MISALYAGLVGVIVIVLAARVSRLRLKYRVGTGCGDHHDLDVAIRCHANTVEYMPTALILLFLAETQNMHLMLVHIFGVLLVMSRILHAWGMTVSQGGTAPGRSLGTLLCWGSISLLSLYNIIKFFILLNG